MTGLLAGCDDTEARTVVVTAHALRGECALPEGARNAELALRPLGDFPAAERVRVPLGGGADGALAIPPGTRALAAEVTIGDAVYLGYSELNDAGLALLLWPARRACRLDGASGYPGRGGGQGLGYDPASRWLVLAGGDDPNQMNKSVEMLGFDAGTGAVRAGLALEEPRANATVTPFAGRLLVAGGEDPLNSHDTVVSSANTATVVAPASVAPLVRQVALRVPRTRHGTAVLPNGDTLLVGGRGPFGDALNLLEAVSDERDTTDVAAFPALLAPRFFPTVLALDDGRLFIGGGTAADASPLSALEWLSRDGRSRLGVEVPEELPARHDRAFVATPGGGVLVVGGCAPRAPRPGEDCGQCREGCPPRTDAAEPEYDAWWLLPDGALRRLELEAEAPRPVLLGDSGRALLAPGTPEGALSRFDPWQARFVPAEDFVVACPPRAGLPVARLDAEAFAWVTDAGACEGAPALFGMRVGTGERPPNELDLVPDRPPWGPDGERARYADGELWFAAESDVRVYVAGRDYADFSLSFELAEDSAAPRLVLTAPGRVGALVLELQRTPGRRLTIARSGSALHVGSAVLSVPEGRVGVGFAAGDGETRLSALALERVR